MKPVLVVTRNPRSLKGLRRALGLAGARFKVVTDEPAAHAAVVAERPELLVLELGAVRHAGPGLVRSMKEAVGEDVPVLLIADSALSRLHDAELLRQVDGVLPGESAPSVLSSFLRPGELDPDARLRVLSALSEITRTNPDRRTMQEQVLDLVYRELAVPCALLGHEPVGDALVLACHRGLAAEAAAEMPLDVESPEVQGREPLIVEAVHGAAGVPGWCAEKGHDHVAVAAMHCRGRIKGVLLVFPEERRLEAHELALLAAVAGQAALLLDNQELFQAARAKQVLVEKLLGRVIYAQEEERKWMAAEIHDTLAQSLVGMLTKVQTCRQLIHADPQQASELLEELRQVVTESIGEIRQIVFNLRPASLDDLGLVPSLENYARRFQQGSEIQLTMSLPGRNQSRLPPLLETTVFRITQEALNNIKKHSGARHARVSLDVGTADLRLTVADDGRGLVWSEVSERFQSGDSHGLHGMQERARLVGGSFRVSNDPNGGTLMEVVIPLARPVPASGYGIPAIEGELNVLLQEVLGATLRGGELAVDAGRNA